MKRGSRTSNVYVLRDPRTNAIRYIGCTTNPKRRMIHHMSLKKTLRCVREWIKELKQLGLRPLMEIVSTHESRWDAHREEQLAIWREASRPGNQLLNIHGRDNWRIERDRKNRRHERQKESVRFHRRLREFSRRLLTGRSFDYKPHPARFIEFNGERLLSSKWAERCGISRERMRQRLAKYPPEQAIGDYLKTEPSIV